MADQQAAELAKPCVGSFDDPPAFVSAQFAAGGPLMNIRTGSEIRQSVSHSSRLRHD